MLIVQILWVCSHATTCLIDLALGCVSTEILLRAGLGQDLGFRVLISTGAGGSEEWGPATLV